MLSELIALLKLIGLPVTYGRWSVGHVPKLPYFVVVEQAREDFMADGEHYYKVQNFDIELYFEEKDPILEDKIESFFDKEAIAYDVSEDMWIDSERFFEKVYNVNLGGK